MLEAVGIDSGAVFPGVDVTEQLPDVAFVSAVKAQKREVVQPDSLFAYFYVHLHCYKLKPVREALTEVFQVMIAEYQVDLSVQAVKNLGPFGGSSQTKIAQVEYGVIGLNYSVPVLNQRLVHLIYVLEGAVAESDYVGMVEMRIGREERVLGVEFVVHVFFYKSRQLARRSQIFANLAEIWCGCSWWYNFTCGNAVTTLSQVLLKEK